jgi:catechol 2,3-dioxygenase-like lactoylglutathione lyase family enzyme
MTGKQSACWSLKMAAPLEPGIVCCDIGIMLEFYQDLLGLKVVADQKATPEMSARFGASPDGYRIVRLQTPYGERLKLVQTTGSINANPRPEWVFERRGFAYLTFIVPSIDEVFAHIKQNGVQLVSPEPIEVRPGFRALFVADPEGNFIEFVEYSDLAAYRPDLALSPQ